MAVKKSELYSSLWESCNQLRGGMDASQYKDYVLVLLFLKYVSDKGDELIEIPPGASFKDIARLKGDPNIGDKMNKIIGKLAEAIGLRGVITVADFNDDDKLGKGKERVDRLSNLIAIFETPALDFSSNRAEGDDLLGDAYEYLMRLFATESGKSKGQFYTPAEVSRIMAKVIGIKSSTLPSNTLYDPTCGSGSLLLRAAAESPNGITVYGQEMDNATRALAVMNMWLHGHADAEIVQGNTLANPLFTNDKTGELEQYDFLVANPPFSYASWMNGLDPRNDIFERFAGYGALPPEKNGDYAFLMHSLKSLKSTGKGCIVMPLGVLFRGNTEGEIRKNIVQRGYIKGIIALPQNLFYGTGIAACLIILDKETSSNRKDIFFIDASKGFIKDGNKNRLREQDIHKIVDTFTNRIEIPKYSRIVPLKEITDAKNDYNLNIPRYIDNQEDEDIQDIEAHLNGGIPARDIDALGDYWAVYPSLKKKLLKKIPGRINYFELTLPQDEIKNKIFSHPEFTEFTKQMDAVFTSWKKRTILKSRELAKGSHPKKELFDLAESLLRAYSGKPLLDKYDIYQHFMDYCAEVMQDDFYEIAAEGWKAGNGIRRIEKTTTKGDKETIKQVPGLEGLEGILIPPQLIITLYFREEQQKIDNIDTTHDSVNAQMEGLKEEHATDDELLANALDEKGKISKASLAKAVKEIGKRTSANAEEYDMLHKFKALNEQCAVLQTQIKTAKSVLEEKVIKKYPGLSIDEIKTIVIEKKWLPAIEKRIQTEMNNISRRLTQRIKELAERYETTLPQQTAEVAELEAKVQEHLKTMGFVWN